MVHKHPEVRNISFLTLQYAGKVKKDFKYSIRRDDKVKKLKLSNQSAGNNTIWLTTVGKGIGTSETLRNETVKKISENKPKHLKPRNEEELGHYIGGLIDGDGHFSSKEEILIALNIKRCIFSILYKKRIKFWKYT